MSNKYYVGYYSSKLHKLISSIIVGIFLICCLIMLYNSYLNFRKTILYQSKFLQNDINSKILLVSFIINNVMLPELENKLTNNNLDRQQSLLSRFKKNQEVISFIQSIMIVNDDLRIRSSSENIKLSIDNDSSLSDRKYLIESKKYPEQIIFGDAVIGKLSKNWSLPLSRAILKNNNIIGYLVISINIDSFTENIMSKVTSPSLTKILMSKDNIPEQSVFYSDLYESGISFSEFLYFCIRSYYDSKYLFFNIKMNNIDKELYIGYELKFLTSEIFDSILSYLLLTMVSLSLFYIIYYLYLKYVLSPIKLLNDNYKIILEKYNNSVGRLNLVEKHEVGYITQITDVSSVFSNKISEYEQLLIARNNAFNIVFNTTKNILNLMNSKSSLINESIEDIIYDVNQHSNYMDTKLYEYLEDLRLHGCERSSMLKIYEQLFEEIFEDVKKPKTSILIEEVRSFLDNCDMNIKFYIKSSNEKYRKIDVYLDSFKKTFNALLDYCKSNNNLEIFVCDSNEKLVIDFAMYEVCDPTIFTLDQEIFLEKAKIFAFVNSGLISRVYNQNNHMITVAFLK